MAIKLSPQAEDLDEHPATAIDQKTGKSKKLRFPRELSSGDNATSVKIPKGSAQFKFEGALKKRKFCILILLLVRENN